MPSLKDLRVRIKSVKSTQKITSAMKMVAAAKLRRAQEQAESARPYADRMARMLESLAAAYEGRPDAPPLLAGTGKNNVHLVIVATSDRGRCGGFNSGVVREARRLLRPDGMIIVKFLVRFLIVFLLVAAMDIFLQRKEYIKNLKMSKDEVKREYKEDEGDPLIKGHRRQLHMEMAMGDVRQKVKNADAVVTNPTHLAIAIQYDKKEMIAPQVVAKGQRLFAEIIKEIAKENDVPIIRNVPLAWALIELEIEDEIPEKLYVATAEILTFVYKMKEEREKGRVRPTPVARPEAPQTPRSLPQLGK